MTSPQPLANHKSPQLSVEQEGRPRNHLGLNLEGGQLKKRINLFEGLLSENGTRGENKDGEEGERLWSRQPKVVTPEQKRWTQLEVTGEQPIQERPEISRKNAGQKTLHGRGNRNPPSPEKTVQGGFKWNPSSPEKKAAADFLRNRVAPRANKFVDSPGAKNQDSSLSKINSECSGLKPTVIPRRPPVKSLILTPSMNISDMKKDSANVKSSRMFDRSISCVNGKPSGNSHSDQINVKTKPSLPFQQERTIMQVKPIIQVQQSRNHNGQQPKSFNWETNSVHWHPPLSPQNETCDIDRNSPASLHSSWSSKGGSQKDKGDNTRNSVMSLVSAFESGKSPSNTTERQTGMLAVKGDQRERRKSDTSPVVERKSNALSIPKSSRDRTISARHDLVSSGERRSRSIIKPLQLNKRMSRSMDSIVQEFEIVASEMSRESSLSRSSGSPGSPESPVKPPRTFDQDIYDQSKVQETILKAAEKLKTQNMNIPKNTNQKWEDRETCESSPSDDVFDNGSMSSHGLKTSGFNTENHPHSKSPKTFDSKEMWYPLGIQDSRISDSGDTMSAKSKEANQISPGTNQKDSSLPHRYEVLEEFGPISNCSRNCNHNGGEDESQILIDPHHYEMTSKEDFDPVVIDNNNQTSFLDILRSPRGKKAKYPTRPVSGIPSPTYPPPPPPQRISLILTEDVPVTASPKSTSGALKPPQNVSKSSDNASKHSDTPQNALRPQNALKPPKHVRPSVDPPKPPQNALKPPKVSSASQQAVKSIDTSIPPPREASRTNEVANGNGNEDRTKFLTPTSPTSQEGIQDYPRRMTDSAIIANLSPRLRRHNLDHNQTKIVGEYAEPMNIQRWMSDESLISSAPSTVLDSQGYSVPGSHLLGHKANKAKTLKPKMRRKINDAFRRKHNTQKTDEDRQSVTSEGSDSEVNDQVKKNRLTYVRAMRLRSSVYCTVQPRFAMQLKLYEYAVIVSLQINEETRRYEPYEVRRFPHEVSDSQSDKLRAIPQFCFPDAFKWAPVDKYNSESFCFVLTSSDGSRLYGYNRRILPPGKGPRLPEVVCIMSPIGCYPIYNQLLDEVENRRKTSMSAVDNLLMLAYDCQFPRPGSHTKVHTPPTSRRKSHTFPEHKPLILQRPQDQRLEHVDFDTLFNCLSVRRIVQIFGSLLLERRVIMCSGKLSKLSRCSQALAGLLYPFTWQHVYVPVLPEKLIDMCCSPTPYIMGMLSLCIPRLEELPLEEVLVVDLDARDFYTVVGDEETILPKKLSQALERALMVCSMSSWEGVDTDEELSEDHESKNSAISEAFIRFFVETVGHYSNHFTQQYDGSQKFDREAFVKVVSSKSVRTFLEVFSETQMFSLFIQEKEAESEGISQGLFERRVKEYENEARSNSKNISAKMKKIGKAVKDIKDSGLKKMKQNLDDKI